MALDPPYAGGDLLGNGPFLPYCFLSHRPFIAFRSSSRYDLMAGLGLGVLTAISLAYVAGAGQKKTPPHPVQASLGDALRLSPASRLSLHFPSSPPSSSASGSSLFPPYSKLTRPSI
jgi:hypothetical protein